VAHGVRIRRHVVLAAHVGLAGSVVVEDGVVSGGHVGVADHLTLGRGSRYSRGSMVANDVDPGVHVAGHPAAPAREFFRSSVLVRQLPALKRRLDAIEARLASLLAKEPS
jgi:UDP-3-O-[3-hydroxymyristoyl] glucosamine N-acyltransferase